jgi:predicted nucleic acid-binding protein
LTRVVVDASLAVKWVLRERHSAEAYALLEEWRAQQLQIVAPVVLASEVANALYKRVVRGDISLVKALRDFTDLHRSGPQLQGDEWMYARAMEMARMFGRPAAYDAQYLALAEREGCELWTADERLWNAVKGTLSYVRWIGEYQLKAV